MEIVFDSNHKNGNNIKKFKVLLLGFSGVGKTNLISIFMNNNFIKNPEPTKSLM
jgi:GTPase SAR1 family protein